MKKRLLLLALLLIGVAACREVMEIPEEETPLTITASFADATTKVTYTEDPSTHKLHQDWEVGDLLYGFDEDDNALCLQVASVDGAGVATLSVKSGVLPADGKKIHMLYAPGGCLGVSSPGDFAEGMVPTFVYFPNQEAATGTTVPAILTADAVVSGSSVSLVFANKTAIVGIKGFHGLPAGAPVSNFRIYGMCVNANISVDENVLTLTTPPFQNDITVSKAGGWTADAGGSVDDVFYVATFPSAAPVEVSIIAELSDGSQYTNDLGSKTISAAKYYYMNDKALSKCVATVQLKNAYGNTVKTAHHSSLGAAMTEVNDAVGMTGALITLLEDCTLSSAFNITNTSLSYVSMDLNGHTLTLNENHFVMETDGAGLSVYGGTVVQSTDDSPMVVVSDGFLGLYNCEFNSSSNSPIVDMSGGDLEIAENAALIHSGAGAKVITCSGGEIYIYDEVIIQHTSASGGHLLYVSGGTPDIWIEDGASFVQAGNTAPLYVAGGVAGGEIRVTIDGAYFHTASTQTLYSVNSGIILVKSAYFNKDNPCMNCTIAPNCTVGKILPTVTYEGRVYNRRIVGSNAAYNSSAGAFISYSVAADRRLYPAKTNITYTPSTSTWAFRPSCEGYSTAYDADLISLFTWGYDPALSIVPDGTAYLETESYSPGYLEPEKDWGSVMNAGNCRVPTKAEWIYLLNERSASTVEGVDNARYMKCKFQDTYGLMLFPDDFSWPASATAATGTVSSAINNPSDQYSVTFYRMSGNALIGAGCVFLPEEGYREGSTVTTTSGNYWSATGRGDLNVFFLTFYNVGLNAAAYTGSKNTGHSVRLFFE